MAEKSIKCICGGTATLHSKPFRLGERILIEEDEVYRCNSCKDEFVTSKQMKSLEKKIRERFFFHRKVISTGRSLAMTLPPDLAEFYHLKKGSQVTIVPAGKNEALLRFK